MFFQGNKEEKDYTGTIIFCGIIGAIGGYLAGACLLDKKFGSQAPTIEVDISPKKKESHIVRGITGNDGVHREYCTSGIHDIPARSPHKNPQYLHNPEFLETVLNISLKNHGMGLEENESIMPVYVDLISKGEKKTDEVLIGFLSDGGNISNEQDPGLFLENALPGRFINASV